MAAFSACEVLGHRTCTCCSVPYNGFTRNTQSLFNPAATAGIENPLFATAPVII